MSHGKSSRPGSSQQGSQKDSRGDAEQGLPGRQPSLPRGYYELYGLRPPEPTHGAVQAKGLDPGLGRSLPRGLLEYYGIVPRAPASADPDSVQKKEKAPDGPANAAEAEAQPADAAPAEPMVVQAKSEGSRPQSESDIVQEAAAHGTSGPSGALPYLAQIQGSFGSHDVSHVKAHTDSKATAGSKAMGAEAFTAGEHVAFAGTPSLHTAAHEAAHVVQQRAGVQLKGGVGEVGDPYERHADAVADLVVRGKSAEALLAEPAGPSRSLEITKLSFQDSEGKMVSPGSAGAARTAASGPSASVSTVQRFAPEYHETATTQGLKGTFTAEEIGLIYQANWERDFSQGSPKIANAVLAWKAVKRSAMRNGGTPSPKASERFKAATWAVVDMSVLEVAKESLGGYRFWEHMDNPDSANDRWGSNRGRLPGYIADSKAYIKDQLVLAADAYRSATGAETIGEEIDNWNGVAKPKGYGIPKEVGQPNSREVIAEDTRDKALAAGAKSATPERGNPFAAASDQLGRATHALEDFFAHSNWLELARELKKSGTVKEDLRTGTFEIPDKCHALGHKLVSLAAALFADFGLLQKVYGRTQGQAATKAKGKYNDALDDLQTNSRTPLGEMIDVVGATQEVEEAVQNGKVDVGDFLVDRTFLEALKRKGEILMAEGEAESPTTGHGRIAKDAPDDQRDNAHGIALQLAIEANRLIIAPLKAIMKSANATAAKKKLLDQLALVDEVLQPPSKGHPLFDFVK
jgi:hypothetical protein